MVAELLQEDEYDESVLPTDEEIAEQIRIEEELKATKDSPNSGITSLFSQKKLKTRAKQTNRPNVSQNREIPTTIQAIDRDFGPDDYEVSSMIEFDHSDVFVVDLYRCCCHSIQQRPKNRFLNRNYTDCQLKCSNRVTIKQLKKKTAPFVWQITKNTNNSVD